MRRATSERWVAAALLFVMLTALFGGTPAEATALKVRADRADNVFYFSYDATTGTVDTASSSLQERRGDPVSHRIYVEAVPGAVVGERLKASVQFRLNSKEKRRFSGAVTLLIRDPSAQTVFESSKDVDFTLRPRKGDRGHRVIFRFDLPTGDYSATSTFRAPPA